MNRLRHRLFTILSALSLLMCVTASVLWITVPSTWHFTIDSGKPATQHNLDLTFVGFPQAVVQSGKWNRWTLVRIQVPTGIVTIVCAVLPIIWLARSKPAAIKGTCPKCGYDLRATPDRCPECGTRINQTYGAGDGPHAGS